MNRFIYVLLILIYPWSSNSAEMETSSLGIFDATADWGSTESPPQRGEFKIPGRVKVSRTEDGLVYDLYGNGNDIWDINDEGFFVYTEKSGSWSISARVEWIDRGNRDNRDPWGKIGPMIREKAGQTNSKFFYALLQPGTERPYGRMINTAFRLKNGSEGYSTSHTLPAFNTVLEEPGPIYLRVTRLAPHDIFYSEWSKDGAQWNLHYVDQYKMEETVAFGLTLTNHADNELLAHVRCTDVRLEPPQNPPILVMRHFPKKQFEKGKPFDVTLNVTNANEEEQTLTIVENILPSCTASRPSHGGSIHDASIAWTINASPGLTKLTYQLSIQEEDIQRIILNEKTKPTIIYGDTHAGRFLINKEAAPSYIWRFWDKLDGFEVLDRRNLYVSASGTVLTEKGTEEFARLDGFSIQTIPGVNNLDSSENNLGLFLPVESAFGDIWSASYTQGSDGIQTHSLLRYKDNQWESYTSKNIFPTTKCLSLIPGAKGQVYLRFPEEIFMFDANTHQFSFVRKTSENNHIQIPLFKSVNSQVRDGSVWTLCQDHLLRIIIPTPWNGIQETVWKEYPYDPEVPVGIGWLPRNNENGGISFANGNTLTKITFDGEKWETRGNLTGGDFFFVDKQDVVWSCNLYKNDLTRIDADQNTTIIRDEHLAGSATDIAADSYAGFWVASQGGLAKISSPLWISPQKISGFNGSIKNIHEDKQGRLWCISEEHLILHENKDTWKIYANSFNAYNNKTWFTLPVNGKMSISDCNIGLGIKLLFFNPSTEMFSMGLDKRGVPLHCYVDHKRKIQWMTFLNFEGDAQYIYRRDSKNEKRIYEFPGNSLQVYPSVLLEDDDGVVWLSYKDEIRHYQGQDYTSFGPEEGYTLTDCKTMLDCGNGIKWCGTDKILAFNGEKWTLVRDGFGTIHQLIKSSDGCIWVASSVGLWKYIPPNEEYNQDRWLRFGVEEGLPSNGVYSVFEDSQHRIWAGTASGLSYYDPNADRDYPQTIVKENEYVNRIAKGSQMFVGYTGKDRWKYTKKEFLVYSTRLNDEEWSPFTSSTIFKTHALDAGDYVLYVRAMDANGNIDPTPAEFHFSVIPDWYEQPGFIVIMIISSIIIMILGFLSIKHYRQLRYALINVRTVNEDLNKANAELQEANAELQQLDQMKSAFVSQASHDLRTPLTAIKSSLDNVIRGVGGGLNEKQSKVIGRALNSVDRLTHLINDVLDINRIESGREVIEKQDILFNQLVQNTVLENQPAANQKHITVSTSGLDEPCHVMVDPGKIERVVGELIGNAIKYTPEGGKVKIHLQHENNKISLSVRDTGIGMSKKECEKIFERFYRTPSSKTLAKGSGLGLSIAKELVELHGGTIQVNSEEGKGTVSILFLPL